MKNSSIRIATLVAVISAVWILSGFFGSSDKPKDSNPTAELKGDTDLRQRVRFRRISAEEWSQEIIIRGQTSASRFVVLRAETTGIISKILVRKGSRVKHKQVILKIDPAERISELKKSNSLLRQRKIEYKAALRLAKRGFRAETKLAEAKALLESAEAKVASIQKDIERTSIVAPFEGILENSYVEKGAFVRVGDRLARVVDLDPIFLVGAISEAEIDKLALGMSATINLINNRVAKGKVHFLGSVADPATRTFKIEVNVPNPTGVIKAGLTSRITIRLKPTKAHFLSSSLLSLSDDGILGVKSITTNKIVQFLPVSILSDQSNGVWVKGLPETLNLITVGQGYVRAGQLVETYPEQGPNTEGVK